MAVERGISRVRAGARGEGEGSIMSGLGGNKIISCGISSTARNISFSKNKIRFGYRAYIKPN